MDARSTIVLSGCLLVGLASGCSSNSSRVRPDGSTPPVFDGGPGHDAGFYDGGPGYDAGFRDAGFRDAGPRRDGGTPDAGEGARAPFSTYFGGSGGEGIRDITTDREGNSYITGGTDSRDLPAARNSYNGGEFDVFVAKYDPDGNLLWSRYYGGPGYDRAYGIEVDAAGFIYVGGRADNGFPVTDGVFQTQFGGSTPGNVYPAQDGILMKLTGDGEVVWASYYGAFEPAEAGAMIRDFDIDAEGNLYVASASLAGDFSGNSPLLQASFLNTHNSPGTEWDGVVSKISNDGRRVLWSRYIGGPAYESTAPSVRVDSQGGPVYLTTSRSSGNGLTTPGAAQPNNAGGEDFLVTRMTTDGEIVYTTFIGGNGDDIIETHNLALDAQDNAIVAGVTDSTNFPMAGNPFDDSFNGSGGSGNNFGDIIVAKISSDGRRLLAATYVGGQSGDGAEGVVVAPNGDVHLSGTSQSFDFPATSNAYQSNYSGVDDDMVYVHLSADLSRLVYATYFGGGAFNVSRSCHIDPIEGSFYFGGESGPGIPTFNAAQPNFGGVEDATLVRLRP